MKGRTFSYIQKGAHGIFKKDSSGTTMVEVIVAFFIMVIILGIFSQGMKLAGTMMIRSDEALTGYRNLAGSYYLEGEEDPSGEKAQAIPPTEVKNQMLEFKTEDGAYSFTSEVTVRTVQDGSGVLKDVVSPLISSGGVSGPGGSDPDGSDPGESENPDEITYHVVCELMTYRGEFTEGDYQVNWNLDGHPYEFKELLVKDSKNNIGKIANAPFVEHYVAQEGYEVPVNDGWVHVEYMPKDVTLMVTHKCGDKILEQTPLTVKYLSNIILFSNRLFPGYILTGNSTGADNAHQASIKMENPEGGEVVFYYEHNENSYTFYGKQERDSGTVNFKEGSSLIYSGKWELAEKIVFQSVLSSMSEIEQCPQVENYTPVQETYRVPADKGSITIPYRPDTVKVIISHKIGDTLLAEPDTLDIGVRYGAKLTLTSKKKLEDDSYKIDNETVTVDIRKPGEAEVVFTYIDDDAPFHPVSGNPTVEVVSGEDDERTIQVQEKMADLFTDFFSNEWGKGSPLNLFILQRYGYKTFTLKNGTKYAVVGYRGMEQEKRDVTKESKLKRVTGVNTDKMLVLDDCKDGGFKNQEDAKILWQYLVENMSGLTTKEKELMLGAYDIKLQFRENEDWWVFTKRYIHYLEQISYTLPTEPETKIVITY